jgi:hypothetical protein
MELPSPTTEQRPQVQGNLRFPLTKTYHGCPLPGGTDAPKPSPYGGAGDRLQALDASSFLGVLTEGFWQVDLADRRPVSFILVAAMNSHPCRQQLAHI